MGEVSLQVGDDVRRDGDCPPPCVGFRRPDHDRVVPQGVHRLFDPDGGVEQVEVPPAEAEQLRSSQPAPGGQEDKGPEPFVDGVCQRGDLGDGGDRPLGAVVLAGAADPAGVTDDELVGHGTC